MADTRKRDEKKPYQVRYIDKTTKSGFGYKSFSNYQLAKKFEAKKTLEEESNLVSTKVREVDQAVEKWLEICETEGTDGNNPVTACTLSNYEYYAGFMKEYDWPKPLQELTPPDIVEWRSWLVLNCPSRYVARKTLAYFKTVLGELVIRGIITANVATGITIKQNSRYDVPIVVPSEADVIALLDASDKLANSKNACIEKAWRRYRPLMHIAVDCGPRPQEYLALAHEAIQDTGINIDRAIEGDGSKISVTKTPSGRRFIETTQGVTVDMVKHYVKKYGADNNHDLVFANSDGGWLERRNWQRRGFNRACEESGLMIEVEDEETGKTREVPKYRPYDLRHFFISMLIEHIPNLKRIQKMAGHKNIEQTLNTYGHLIDKRQDEEDRKLKRFDEEKEPGVIGWL